MHSLSRRQQEVLVQELGGIDAVLGVKNRHGEALQQQDCRLQEPLIQGDNIVVAMRQLERPTWRTLCPRFFESVQQIHNMQTHCCEFGHSETAISGHVTVNLAEFTRFTR